MKSKDQILLEQAYQQVQEGTAASVGHTLLDIAGLIPGVGEYADATNAVWYCLEGNYLYAALSLISCVPMIGDLVGKGTKLGMFLSKAGPHITKAKTVIAANRPLIDQIFEKASENEKLSPHTSKMQEALIAFSGGKPTGRN